MFVLLRNRIRHSFHHLKKDYGYLEIGGTASRKLIKAYGMWPA